MQMNDGIRIESGRTNIALADGSLDPQTYQTLLLGLAKQSMFGKQFEDLGPRIVLQTLQEFSAGSHGRAIEVLRPAILGINQGEKVGGADAQRWREAMAARIPVWARAVQATFDDLTATSEALHSKTTWRFIAYLLGTLTAIVVVIFLSRMVLLIVRTLLGDLTTVMQELADRRLSVDVPSRDRIDEIGVMARTVEVFKQNAVAIKNLEDEREQQKERAATEKHRVMRELADAFEAEVLGIVQRVSTAASQLQQNANVMNTTATETGCQSMLVAAAAEQSIENGLAVANATSELSSSIHEIGRQASSAAKITADAVAQAGTMTEMVQGLERATKRIGEVISLINAVASQTNLLALNATIEAARAGEFGRGFAVVAMEVKNLASQTARATEEIAAQINAVQGGTTQVVSAIQTISATVYEINTISASIAAAVEQQNATTVEIARNAEYVAGGSREVSSNIAGVSQLAANTGRVSKEMLKAAVDLAGQAEALRSGVDGFIARVRTA
jgi:methyl-accepting chemotaxis protein